MTQIKGIIDQAHWNHDLEQIKQLYHSNNALTNNEKSKDNNNDNGNQIADNKDFDKEEDDDDDFNQFITGSENNINGNKLSFERTMNL